MRCSGDGLAASYPDGGPEFIPGYLHDHAAGSSSIVTTPSSPTTATSAIPAWFSSRLSGGGPRLHHAGYLLVVVTNQGGVARGRYGERDVEAVRDRLHHLLGTDVPIAFGSAPTTRAERSNFCPRTPNGESRLRACCSTRRRRAHRSLPKLDDRTGPRREPGGPRAPHHPPERCARLGRLAARDITAVEILLEEDMTR